MKPKTVHGISIHGQERNAAQDLAKLERDVARLHAQDYRAAGMEPPPKVREQAGEREAEVKA